VGLSRVARLRGKGGRIRRNRGRFLSLGGRIQSESVAAFGRWVAGFVRNTLLDFLYFCVDSPG
jgi:hypothetical protein